MSRQFGYRVGVVAAIALSVALCPAIAEADDSSAVFSATGPADGATSYPEEATYCGDLGRGDDFAPGTLVIVDSPPHVKALRAARPQQ